MFRSSLTRSCQTIREINVNVARCIEQNERETMNQEEYHRPAAAARGESQKCDAEWFAGLKTEIILTPKLSSGITQRSTVSEVMCCGMLIQLNVNFNVFRDLIGV